MRLGTVALEAVGLGIADHVQPVAAPTLAIVRRSQQPIDQFFVSVGRGVGHIGGDLGRRRRQPGQIVRHAAKQCHLSAGSGGAS